MDTVAPCLCVAALPVPLSARPQTLRGHAAREKTNHRTPAFRECLLPMAVRPQIADYPFSVDQIDGTGYSYSPLTCTKTPGACCSSQVSMQFSTFGRSVRPVRPERQSFEAVALGRAPSTGTSNTFRAEMVSPLHNSLPFRAMILQGLS